MSAEDLGTLADRLCDEQAAAMRGIVWRAAGLRAFGHSMGALLAHGMAQRLRERGERLPRALIALGQRGAVAARHVTTAAGARR